MMQFIVSLIMVVLVALFAGFNMTERCDINLIFYTFKNVPVFLALIIAFVVGVVITLPYVFLKRHQRVARKKEKHGARVSPVMPTSTSSADELSANIDAQSPRNNS
ncbi:MAG: hypothetical protein IJ191_10195 [Treponema sp.]|nr:hypothetical protein [Treponema sp.]